MTYQPGTILVDPRTGRQYKIARHFDGKTWAWNRASHRGRWTKTAEPISVEGLVAPGVSI